MLTAGMRSRQQQVFAHKIQERFTLVPWLWVTPLTQTAGSYTAVRGGLDISVLWYAALPWSKAYSVLAVIEWLSGGGRVRQGILNRTNNSRRGGHIAAFPSSLGAQGWPEPA
jgi:hypothetical protein